MTWKNRYIQKITAVIIICAMLCSLTWAQPVNAEESYSEVSYSLNADEVDDTSLDLYMHENTLYISIADLCSLTRCEQSEENSVITVTQGIVNTEFNAEEQTFHDAFQSTDMTILEIGQGQYAVPALMFLSYFKATAFIDGDTLYCRMPPCTAWEALDIDYRSTKIDIYDLYNGKGGVESSMACDLIMDFIMGNLSTSDGYLNDAFVNALSVNLYDYDAVEQYVKDTQGKLSEDIQSDSGIQMLDALQNILKLSGEPVEWYIQNHYNMLERSFVQMAYNVYQKGYVSEVSRYGEEFYNAFTEKNRVNSAAGKYFSDANYLMLFISSIAETVQQTIYNASTDDLAYNVMGKENMVDLDMDVGDNDWFRIANQFQNILGTGVANLKDTVISYVTSNTFWDESIGIIVSAKSGINEGTWGFALDVARLFAENFPLTKTLMEGYEADLSGIFLSELQQNVYAVVARIVQKMQEQPDNTELYKKLLQAEKFYCRVSIAMYENLSISADQFWDNPEYWKTLFKDRIDNLAVSLYQLSNIQEDNMPECFPMDIESFDAQSISGNAQPPEAQQQNGSNTNAEPLFTEFISSGAYEEFTSDWSCEPDGYAFVDIDQDGVVELIIKGAHGDDFSSAAVFKINMSDQSITNIGQFDYCYDLQYSQAYKALVYANTRPSVMETIYGFYVIEDGSLINSFNVSYGQVYGIEYDDPTVTQYTDGLTSIAFNPLIDLIRGTGQAENKVELSGYLNDFASLQGLLQGTIGSESGEYAEYRLAEGGSLQYARYHDSQQVDYLVTTAETEYQIYGVYVGQDVSLAKNTLSGSGWELSSDITESSTYSSGLNNIVIYWDNSDQVTMVVYYVTVPITNAGATSGSIVGTWEMQLDGETYRMQFTSDGEAISYEPDGHGGSDESPAYYRVNEANGILQIYDSYGEELEEPWYYTVTGNTLTLTVGRNHDVVRTFYRVIE